MLGGVSLQSEEEHLEQCPMENWHLYRLLFTPDTNFKVEQTRIRGSDGREFKFQGFSVLSRYSLDGLPECTFDRYGGRYKVRLLKDHTHKNFTLKEAVVFEEYLFVKLMELYDWAEYLSPFSRELFFVPRFCSRQGSMWELLSMAEVLQYLVNSHQPLTQQNMEEFQQNREAGFLVSQPCKVPSCVRVEEVISDVRRERVKGGSGQSCKLLLRHVCSQLQRKARNHCFSQSESQKKLRTLQSKKDRGKLTQKEHFELNALKHDAKTMAAEVASQLGENFCVSLPWNVFNNTGMYYDIPQHTLGLVVFSHHILLYDSLKTLQSRLDYSFSDASLLHRALTHPSSTTSSFVVAEDNIRNALSNCGLMSPAFLPPRGAAPSSKTMKELIKAVRLADQPVKEAHRLQHNEQLEFLGDAVLEYVCSKHLFLTHPEQEVGMLNQQRQLLVKNKHLIGLARGLELSQFLLVKPKVKVSEDSMNRILSNCVEAIIGAVFLDGGLQEAEKVFVKLAFPEEVKYEEWMRPRVHSLVEKYPHGDRHLIGESEVLKGLLGVEEKIGVTFKNLLLLAKAFVHSSCTNTDLTGGNYQRLEHLGDAVLQFLVSQFVYSKFPSHSEGHLSVLRTSLVHNKHLATICEKLGFEKFIILSKTEKVEVSVKIMADVVESFLAALTLDQGLASAQRFLEEHLYPQLRETASNSKLVDANTRLTQAAAYTSKQRGVPLEIPVFRKVKQEGPPDKPTFTVAVYLGERKLAVGTGSS